MWNENNLYLSRILCYACCTNDKSGAAHPIKHATRPHRSVKCYQERVGSMAWTGGNTLSWCNGSTPDFQSGEDGSVPFESTNSPTHR